MKAVQLKEALDALDQSISDVCGSEVERLSPHGIAAAGPRVDRALRSLKRLQGQQQPKYDEWDAVFYASWYQARQVNLGLTALTCPRTRPPSPREGSRPPLRVVDVGGGAWALSFALAVLAARGHSALRDRTISVDCIDRSAPMMSMGEKLWEAFWCQAADRGLTTLVEVVDRMTDGIRRWYSAKAYLDHLRSAVEVASAHRWIVSLHAVYSDSKDDIRELIAGVREHRYPQYEVVTTNKWKSDYGRDAMRSGKREPVAPFLTPEFLDFVGSDPFLKRTTGWRKQLLEDLRSPGALSQSYLSQRVCWDYGKNPIRNDSVWVRSGVR